MWDGYPAARDRVFDMIDSEPHHRRRDPHRRHPQLVGTRRAAKPVVSGYDPKTGERIAAVEIVTPAVSSPPMFSSQAQRDVATMLQPLAPHLKFLEGDSRGYVLLDITPKTLQADWYFVPTVTERTDAGEARGTLRL